MGRFFNKPYAYAYIFAIFLTLSTVLALLGVFVIPSPGEAVRTPTPSTAAPTRLATPAPSAEEAGQAAASSPSPSPTPFVPVITETSYRDGNISITIETLREFRTDLYIADVELSSPHYLKTALAKDAFGLNIREKTSVMAARNGAILAVNGDYYGANKAGFVLKNGVLYRDSVRTKSGGEDLVIYDNGAFGLITEKSTDASSLIEQGVTQLLAFGPALVKDGLIAVSMDGEVGQAITSNPRTAIGMVEPLHYVFVVSDGRTQKSSGLSLYQLAEVMVSCGCVVAYNLDGGGSSTMVFNGRIVNVPTTNGDKIAERSVSDIVYIGA